MMIAIAIAVMIGCTIAVHLNLPQAICGVVSKICKCHKCLSFWGTIVVLLLMGCNIIIAAMFAIAMAYLSNWFAMLLVWLNYKYEELWLKLNRKKM
jgi:hypothetical protein